MISPHPNTTKLRERMCKLPDAAKPWSGTWYRATTAEFANRQDLLTGIGSRMQEMDLPVTCSACKSVIAQDAPKRTEIVRMDVHGQLGAGTQVPDSA
jgi:hypothetical protein